MSRYIDRDKLYEFAHNHIDGTIDCNDIMRFPTIEIEEPTPRYIDANAAIKSFKDLHIEGNCYTPAFIVEFLEKQPTADVQEVKHGKWTIRYEGTYSRARCYCSVCGMSNGVGGIISNQKKPYCPTCGAKMREEKEND